MLVINFPYAAISVQVSVVVVSISPHIEGSPIAVVADTPVTFTRMTGTTCAAPTKADAAKPPATIDTPDPCTTVTDPIAEVEAMPVGLTTAVPVVVTEPIAVADERPDGSTTVIAVPHEPELYVDLPQPENVGIKCYASLMIAADALAAGNWIVKSPELEDLSDPKSKTATALSDCVSLYIRAPRAVMLEELHVVSAKSVNAVVLDVVGVTFVNVLPVAV